MLQPGTLQFVPAANTTSTFSGTINGGGSIAQNGPGTTILSGTNNYSGSTTISSGALQANFGTGIPSSSFLSLDGGVLQSDGGSTVNFTRSLGTSGATFQWTANGGGFSAGNAPMVVNIGGNSTPDTLTWGTAHGRRRHEARRHAQVRLDQRRRGDDVPEPDGTSAAPTARSRSMTTRTRPPTWR